MTHVAVIDIGKTNAKVAVVAGSARYARECEVLSTPNPVRTGPPYPHADTERLMQFILDALAQLHRSWDITAITVTTHGATVALLNARGELALPVLDYEHAGPDALRVEYDTVRAPFSETGSPGLPQGLNVGAQLYWQARHYPDDMNTVVQLLSYPQYWVYRLSGQACNEWTSLGCHTDLWLPRENRPSSLAISQGWAQWIEGCEAPGEAIGTLLPAISERTGLPAETTVHVGIHDSNASLTPHLIDRRPPFSVISTGTWVVCLAVGETHTALDETRDTLLNVNAFGAPVPSARFMGGRERDVLYAKYGIDSDVAVSEADVANVLQGPIMLFPATAQGSGPFPAHSAHWSEAERSTSLADRDPDESSPAAVSPAERRVAIDFYLALMCYSCLQLIGADGPVVVEGPFAGNTYFCQMLAHSTGRPVHGAGRMEDDPTEDDLPCSAQGAQVDISTGTAVGAARLVLSVVSADTNAVPFVDDGPAATVTLPDANSSTAAQQYLSYANDWLERVTEHTSVSDTTSPQPTSHTKV